MRVSVTANAARRKVRTETIPAAVHGLVERTSSVVPDMLSADVLENWIPTQKGARVRGGSPKVATIGEAVTSLMTYRGAGSEKLFAASAASVYEVTALNDSVVPTAAITGQSSGYYGSQMMGTSGGEFLLVANGSDYVWYFDNTDWNPITDVAVNNLAYDAKTADFTAGETVTGGTSGATATILAVIPATTATGSLKIGPVTGGPFQDNETVTSAGGSADANGAEAVASAITITGVATTALSAPWQYASRVFFVEQGTQSAWYLPVDAIGGAALEFSLAGIFKKGGALLMGGAWSIDSGDGMDDRCVFVSDKGEVVIFAGTDPSTAADWVLQGRYDMAEPLGINARMQAGGDFLVATKDGIVPLSQIVQKDPAALSLAAVTRPIERLWAFEADQNSGSVELIKWDDNALGLVVLPSSERALLVNLQTGAWGIATNWGMDCAAVFSKRCFGGFADGSIRALDEQGQDNGAPYVAKYCHAFSGYGDETSYKQGMMMRAAFYAPVEFDFASGLSFDYCPSFGSSPDVADTLDESEFLIWGQGNWDEKKWYADDIGALTSGFIAEWKSVSGGGHTMAPTFQVTCNSTTKPSIELVQIDLSFFEGGAIV